REESGANEPRPLRPEAQKAAGIFRVLQPHGIGEPRSARAAGERQGRETFCDVIAADRQPAPHRQKNPPRETTHPRIHSMGLIDAARRAGRCSNTLLTTLKIAVTAPIPSASVSDATTVKRGCLRSERNARRKSVNIGKSK